ncbi:hypothetical protein HWV62_2087 [Athelia sp. TMB]|nr:hypothetical protein HWV62_2087 [Athelia sp. TMB]
MVIRNMHERNGQNNASPTVPSTPVEPAADPPYNGTSLGITTFTPRDGTTLGVTTFTRKTKSDNVPTSANSPKPLAVDPSCKNLTNIVMLLQPPLECATLTNLLDALEANSMFATSDPSPEFLEFLERIETADPQAFNETEDEDNLGSNWGHYQYTAGKLTLTSVIKTWASVGSPSYAIRLLAASLTTCNVARWLCRTHSVPPSCYLSDNYLAELAALLWSHWKAAGGPIMKGKDKYTEPEPPKDLAMQIEEDTNRTGNGPVNPLDALEPKVGGESGQSANTDTTMHDPQSAIPDTHDLDPQDHKKSISILHVPELKQYAKDQGLSFRNSATKSELVEMICTLPSAQIPSEDTIQGIVRKVS